MRFVLFLMAMLAGCDVPFAAAQRQTDWPLQVTLAPVTRAFDAAVPYRYCALGRGDLVAATGRVGASDYVIGTGDDYVWVDLPGRSAWARTPAPITPSARALILGLLREDAPGEPCASAEVMPFADPSHVIVTTPAFVRSVDLSSGRFRILDQNGAMLEACRMEPGRRELRCSLDLSWDEARFDMDGVELTGSFQPHWDR